MMTQAPTFALAALLLLLSPAAHATVESTCKSVTKVDYDFCVNTLNSDPGSATADVRGLAVIATNAASKKATYISGKINELLKSSQDNATKQSLYTCDQVYTRAIVEIATAVKAIQQSLKDEALTQLTSSLNAPSVCEGGFVNNGAQSPLVADDDEQRKLCGLALDITSLT